jgi:hypothetical protein
MATEGRFKAPRGPKTTFFQQMAMIEWLENRIDNKGTTNFDVIVGRAQAKLKNVQAGAKLKKETAFADLAAFVNQKCGCK